MKSVDLNIVIQYIILKFNIIRCSNENGIRCLSHVILFLCPPLWKEREEIAEGCFSTKKSRVGSAQMIQHILLALNRAPQSLSFPDYPRDCHKSGIHWSCITFSVPYPAPTKSNPSLFNFLNKPKRKPTASLPPVRAYYPRARPRRAAWQHQLVAILTEIFWLYAAQTSKIK